MNPLDFKLTVDRDRIPATGFTDLTFSVELRNISDSAVDIYAKMAQWMPASGWSSPAWDIALESPQFTPRLRELRTYFGPPGMPPNSQVFENQRESLAAGKSWRAQVNACFLPRTEIPDAEITRDVLDPKGMDGITDAELAQSVLVLHATSRDIRKRPAGELLKHGFTSRLAFVPQHGTLDIFMRYHQQPWSGFFKPKQPLVVESNRLTLYLG